jgi:hypothetical protein
MGVREFTLTEDWESDLEVFPGIMGGLELSPSFPAIIRFRQPSFFLRQFAFNQLHGEA